MIALTSSVHVSKTLWIHYHICFGKYHTLPADAANCLEPLARAYDEDCAILLPRKHLAFMGCKRCGDVATFVAALIVKHYLDLLEEGMHAYERLKSVGLYRNTCFICL